MSVLETLEIVIQADLSGVTAQLSGLSAQLRGIPGQALAVSGLMRAAGVTLADNLKSGLLSGVSGAKIAGYQMSSGFASGIRSGQSVITSAVSSVVNSALRRMRSLLSIHSPSKVTRSLGGYFGEGFAQGILGSVSLAERAAGSLSHSALDGLSAMPDADAGMSARMQTAVESALGNVQLVVPLHVDGMKLGEASIRGINAVTKSAGKVLLNI